MRPLAPPFALVLLLLGPDPGSHAINNGRTLAIRHVNVIPMDGGRILENQTVLVRERIIVRIGDSDRIGSPAGAESVDAGGMYLIPGLIDAHVHLYAPEHLALYLANGVTTVFNLNGRPLHLAWRSGTASGKIAGPRIFTVGPKFDRADPPATASALVEQYWRQGYDGIKIYNGVSKAEYPSLVAAARKHRLLIVGHIAREPGFEATLQAGQAIAHAEEYLYTFFKEHGNGGPPDPALIPLAVSLTKRAGVPVIATLVTYEHIVEQATGFEAYLRRPEMKYWAPWELENIKDPGSNPYLNLGSDEIEELRRNYPFLKALVKALHDRGVPILAGSDSGGIANVPGFSLQEELQILVQSGLTPLEALRCATVEPARFLRAEGDLGTIAEGKTADLVLLRGNPLKDIANTGRIAGVVVNGRWLDRATLDASLERIPARYAEDEREVEAKLGSDLPGALAYLQGIDPFFELGAAVMRRMALDKGSRSFEEVVRASKAADPGTPVAQPEFINDIADFLLESRKPDEALALHEFNVAQNPESAIAWDRLARTYYRLSRLDLALKFYRRALEVDPGYWNADFARKRVEQLSERPAVPGK